VSANRLYYGDNLEVLRKHVHDETVDLCYIDPPFNSKRTYNQIYNNVGREDRAQEQAFVDTWIWDDHANECFEHILFNTNGVQTRQSIDLIRGLETVLGRGSLFAYLVNMTVRIAEIRRALKPTGSFYLHCDPTASHYLKLVCDTIFIPQGGDYKNEVIWKRTSAHNDPRRCGSIHDVLFFYTKSENYVWNKVFQKFSPEYVEQYYRYEDGESGRKFMSDNLTGAGAGPPRDFGKKGVLSPPDGRHWMFDQAGIDKALKENRIFWTRNGVPRLKKFLDESKGMPIQDIWDDIQSLRSWHQERLGYPTQKPEALLERIIKACSNEGDVVLDTYCGCGTTTAVAQRLNRRWVGIDITYQSISLVLKRLEDIHGKDVLDEIILDGIPRDMASANALAHKKDDRVRKEFEKWAILTYTNNRAVINGKRGADGGIDGTAYFMEDKRDNAKIVFQVKSGGVKRNDIASLRGDMEREKAALAILITLEEPSRPMIKDANAAGSYHHAMMGRNYDKIQIVTVKDIIERDARLSIPTSLEVLKAAQRKVDAVQLGFESAAYLSPVTATEEPRRKDAHVAQAAKPRSKTRKKIA
jgi:DNA modification methylase